MSVKKIGKYTLQDEISRGGMGIVFRGMDEDLKRPLAIKMLPKEYFTNQEQKDRFILEAQIVAKLDHPNIMKVYSIEYAEETVWIVMELLEGTLLSDLMKKEKQVAASECVNILSQLSEALNYAHAKGIVHRDIKPANVFINKEGIVKLMDFGIARDVETDLHLTRAGTIMGTPKYMSPEQFTGETVDGRSDIYSLGIMAFEMLMGDVPFKGKTIAELAYKQIHEPLPSMKRKEIKIPSELEKIIRQMLSKKKDSRPSDLSLLTDMGEGTVVVNVVKKKIKFYYIFVIILFFFVIILTYSIWVRHSKELKVKTEKANMLIVQLDDIIKKKDWVKAKGVISQISSLELKKINLSKYHEEVGMLEKEEKDKANAQTLFANLLKSASLDNMRDFNKNLDEIINLDPLSRQFFISQAAQKIKTLKQNKARKMFLNALKYLNEGKEEEYQQELEKAIQLDPFNKENFTSQGEKKLSSIRKSQAQLIFSKALKCIEEEEFGEYESLIEEAQRLDPGENFKEKGLKALNSFRGTKAQEHYEKAIRFAGKNDIQNSNLELKKCIQLNSSHSSAYYLLAENCLEEDEPNYPGYLNYLKKSLAVDPYNEAGWDSLTRYYSQIGDRDKAKEACKKGISYFKDSESLNNLYKTL